MRGTDDKARNEKLRKYEETLTKIKELLNDSEVMEAIIQDIGSSEKETVDHYKANKARRIEAMVTKAGGI